MSNPIRLLIVEDSVDDAELLLTELVKHGLELQWDRVDTEADYLAKLDNSPDLILADYRLPHFSGARALELLNERRLQNPINLLSVTNREVQPSNLIKAGASDFLLKDRMARLGPAVTQTLKLKRARDERHQLEQALIESARKFQLLWETTTDAVIMLGEDNRIQYANPAVRDIFGYAPDEVQGKDIAILQPERFREPHRRGMNQFLQSNKRTRDWRAIERAGLHRDGREFPAEITYSHMIVDGKQVFAGFIRDITERKRAEQLVRLEHMVASAFADAGSGSSALKAVIRSICEIQGWECGRYLRVDEQAGVLRVSESWHVPDDAIERFIATRSQVVYGLGVGLAGCVWQSGQPAWIADINDDARTLGAAMTHETGMRGAFHFPVISEGKTIGVLAFNSRKVQEPDGRLLQTVHTIGNQIGQYVVRMEQRERIVRLNRVYAVLSGINTTIVRVHERDELFAEACRIAVEHGKFVMAWIGMLDPATREIRPAAKAGCDDGYLDQIELTADEKTPGNGTLVAQALSSREPVVCNDIGSEERIGQWRDEALKRGYRSVALFPLLLEQSPVGIFVLYASEPGFFDEQEMRLLIEMAGDISFALEHIGKEKKIARLSRIEAVTSGINSLIVRVRDRQELFDGACRIAVEHGQFGIAWIGTLDPNTLDVIPVAYAGIDSELLKFEKFTARSDVPAGQGAVGRAIREKRPAVIHDFTSAPYAGGTFRKEAISRGYRSLVVFPLLVDDSVVGILALFVQEVNFFTDDELKLLDELAGDVSYALAYMAKEEKLNYLAYYDALTGLPNRALFDDRMAQHLRAASHEKNKVALVLINLERFRVINDTLGRSAADNLLKLVAERLQGCMFDRDSLARVHGDVFAGLFTAIKDEADIARIVEEKIIGCLNEPFTLAGQEVRVSAKAGVALFPADATEPEALFSSAEAALRQAQDSSERYLFYARKMNALVAERLKLENKLQRALERDEFVLFYQPKVDLNTGRVIGLEALIRWNDPGTGLVMPMLFIPLLEETGMIVEVGAWAMKQAVSQRAAWQAAGLQPPWIAVNVSQLQLKRKDFVATVQQAIAVAGKPDHGLDLEITESMIMEDIESTIEKLKIIRDLGVGISIDDFGTGYSSLRYLTRLPITALKIDRAFIRHMATNSDDVAIVSTVIALGHNLNLNVIAEGVETEQQRKLLKLLKCDSMQGYLFSKPVPAAEVEALFSGYNPAR